MDSIKLCDLGRLRDYLQEHPITSETSNLAYQYSRKKILEKYHRDIQQGKEAYKNLAVSTIYGITIEFVDYFIEFCKNH